MLGRHAVQNQITIGCSDGNLITKLVDNFILIEEYKKIKRLLGKTGDYFCGVRSVGEIELYHGIIHHGSVLYFKFKNQINSPRILTFLVIGIVLTPVSGYT